MFSKVYIYNPSKPIYSYFFAYLYWCYCYLRYIEFIIVNLLKPYNGSCIETNANILMDLTIFFCISDEQRVVLSDVLCRLIKQLKFYE